MSLAMRLQESALLVFLSLLAISSVSVSILVLRRGREKLAPASRPRRWVLLAILTLFSVFFVWFPILVAWPHSWFSRWLTALFGITFFVVGITFRWFSALVDWFVERRGWRLR